MMTNGIMTSKHQKKYRLILPVLECAGAASVLWIVSFFMPNSTNNTQIIELSKEKPIYGDLANFICDGYHCINFVNSGSKFVNRPSQIVHILFRRYEVHFVI